jgi:hypothetical protein
MKTVAFEQARSQFQQLFDLAADGETIVIERADQRVALHRLGDRSEQAGTAPPGYFLQDYSREEIAELNALASQAPQAPLP